MLIGVEVLLVVPQYTLSVLVSPDLVDDVSAPRHRQARHHHAPHHVECTFVYSSPCSQLPREVAADVSWQELKHPIIVIVEVVFVMVEVTCWKQGRAGKGRERGGVRQQTGSER